MNKLRRYFALVFGMVCQTIVAQPNPPLTIKFTLDYMDKTISLSDSSFANIDSNNTTISSCKFYLSSVQLLFDQKILYTENNSFHLINFEDTNTCIFSLKSGTNLPFNTIQFYLGIDSITNTAGAMGGDLDPTKGMYWTWQSGYINFKLEGKSLLCKTPNHEFQYHLGGFQYPFNALQSISLKTEKLDAINIHLDLNQILNDVDLSKRNHIMSPCTEAVQLSANIAKAFRIINE